MKRNFDALQRDEWRLSVQPILGKVVRDCAFASGRKPPPLQLFESIENSQAKGNIFKKKEEVHPVTARIFLRVLRPVTHRALMHR